MKKAETSNDKAFKCVRMCNGGLVFYFRLSNDFKYGTTSERKIFTKKKGEWQIISYPF